jgi:hypothetical protein
MSRLPFDVSTERYQKERQHAVRGPCQGSFGIVQGKSKEEVIERFLRAPFDGGQEIEIRQIFEVEDFGELPPHVLERGQRMREALK